MKKPDFDLENELGPRIGGIALKNGVALVTERHWAAAIRETDGSISVASGQKMRLPGSGGTDDNGREAPARRPATATRPGASRPGAPATGAAPGGVPLLRGLGRFGESLLVLGLIKARLPQAQLPLEGGRVATALAASFAATSAIKAAAPRSAVVQEVGAVLAAFVPAVLALKNSTISGYHGAEHKVIGGHEQAVLKAGRGRSVVTGDSAAAAKEHDRCGSNLIGPYLLATVVTNVLARGRSGRKSPAASAVASAASLGIALEALRWASQHGDSIVAKLLLSPGRAIQKRLTTTEPTPDQLEVGERALTELIRLENAPA